MAALQARFFDAAAQRELDLDLKLTALIKPMASKAPDKAAPQRLREFARKNEGTSVGARAERLAKLAEQAIAIR